MIESSAEMKLGEDINFEIKIVPNYNIQNGCL